MNYSNFFLASLILIITGCKNLVENTNEKLKIIDDVEVNIKDEKILPNQNIEEEFKLTDENVLVSSGLPTSEKVEKSKYPRKISFS